MKLVRVSNEARIHALTRNIINAANLTWNECGQSMLPLRWGAAHRAVINCIRTTLEMHARAPVPSSVYEVARQVVDAVEWGNNAYRIATQDELNRVVEFLNKDLYKWLRTHFISEMAGGATRKRAPSRTKSVRTFTHDRFNNIIMEVKPDALVYIDKTTTRFEAKRVYDHVKVIDQGWYNTAADYVYPIDVMPNGLLSTHSLSMMKDELESMGGLILLGDDVDHRTIPCLMPKPRKSGKVAEWVVFNMPTHHYSFRLNLRLPFEGT